MTKKKNKHDKIVLLQKTKLNTKEVIISQTLIDSYISHDEFVLVDNVLKEYHDMEEEIKNIKTSTAQQRSINKTILYYCFKCRKNAESKNLKVVRNNALIEMCSV